MNPQQALRTRAIIFTGIVLLFNLSCGLSFPSSSTPSPSTTANGRSNHSTTSMPGRRGGRPHKSPRSRRPTRLWGKPHPYLYWPGEKQTEEKASTVHANGDHDAEHEVYEQKLNDIFDTIIKIHCTHSEPDYLMPWQKIQQSTSTSSGFVISNRQGELRIMTNAHSVEYASIVQVQRRGDSHKFEATIDAIGNECDLAVLKVESEDFWKHFEGKERLGFGPLPALQDDVDVLGYPTGGDSMSVTSGVVSRVEMQEYAQSGTSLLAVQVDAAINPGNSGGPVVNTDLQVVGVAFQGLDSAENIGYVVPVTVVQHFLEDISRNGRFTGFCSVGMRLSLLENPAMRKSLHMKDGQSGVMVLSVSPLSKASTSGALQANDVILTIDDIVVANDGKIPFRPGERVSLVCYVQTKFEGDTIRMKILRNGVELDQQVPIGINGELVPVQFHNKKPPYLVVGGLVFTALSVPYLNAYDAWDDYVSDNISYLLQFVDKPLQKAKQQIVVMSQVLAHRANMGYDQYSNLHLKKFNGHEIDSLQQLHDLVQSCQDEYARFEFAPSGRVIVLERAQLQRITDEVCEEHSIPNEYFVVNESDEDVEDEKKDEEEPESVD